MTDLEDIDPNHNYNNSFKRFELSKSTNASKKPTRVKANSEKAKRVVKNNTHTLNHYFENQKYGNHSSMKVSDTTPIVIDSDSQPEILRATERVFLCSNAGTQYDINHIMNPQSPHHPMLSATSTPYMSRSPIIIPADHVVSSVAVQADLSAESNVSLPNHHILQSDLSNEHILPLLPSLMPPSTPTPLTDVERAIKMLKEYTDASKRGTNLSRRGGRISRWSTHAQSSTDTPRRIQVTNISSRGMSTSHRATNTSYGGTDTPQRSTAAESDNAEDDANKESSIELYPATQKKKLDPQTKKHQSKKNLNIKLFIESNKPIRKLALRLKL